jgi:uncharacterized phiE125 gp8 family phage protein
MYRYYPHEEGYIDIVFRVGPDAFDPDQDASFYVELYDSGNTLRHTLTLSSDPAIVKIDTGEFKVEGIDLSDFESGVAYYKWYAKVSGAEISTYPVTESCFEVLEAVSDTLCTLDDVKDHLRISSSDHDAFLTSLLGRVTTFIEGYCHRTFAETTHTEYRTGDGERDMVLRHKPITSITGIEDVYGGAGFNYDGDDEHDYWECDYEAGILYLLQDVFPSSPVQTVKVTYTAGYATVPEDVRQVAVELVASKWYLKERQAEGVQSISFGGEQKTYRRDELTPMQVQALAPYRHQSMGAV